MLRHGIEKPLTCQILKSFQKQRISDQLTSSKISPLEIMLFFPL